MIIHYGYRDASGEYFITVDAGRCDGCGACIEACPKQALELTTAFVGLEDKRVAGVKDDIRRRLRDVCAACGRDPAPCAGACPPGCLAVIRNENPADLKDL